MPHPQPQNENIYFTLQDKLSVEQRRSICEKVQFERMKMGMIPVRMSQKSFMGAKYQNLGLSIDLPFPHVQVTACPDADGKSNTTLCAVAANQEFQRQLGYTGADLSTIATSANLNRLSFFYALHSPEQRPIVDVLDNECCTLGRQGYQMLVTLLDRAGNAHTMMEIAKYKMNEDGSFNWASFYFIPLTSM
jgi:hypothetical protein